MKLSSALSSGLAGSPVTFTAEGTPGAATKLALTTAPSSTAQNGVALAQQPVLQLQEIGRAPGRERGEVAAATVRPAGEAPSNATANTACRGSATLTGHPLT